MGGALGTTGSGLGAGGRRRRRRAFGYQHSIGTGDGHRLPGHEVSLKLFGRETVAPQPDHMVSRRHAVF